MVRIPDYSTIKDLLKMGLTIEAQEKIMALREAAVELKAENTELKEQLAELKKKSDMREKLVWEPPYYFLKDGDKLDGPYCQHCFDKDQKLIRLQRYGDGGWECRACDNMFYEKAGSRCGAEAVHMERSSRLYV